MPLLSIIIPVYNSEDYLSSCLDSIICQSFTDFEILLIDDGSTDQSPIICDEYTKKDQRFKVFHKENGGVSSSRNIGLDNARGIWVMFVDSDDLLPSDALKNLMKSANGSIDMAIGGFRKFNEQNAELETIRPKIGFVSPERCIADFIIPCRPSGDWQRYIWNRLFRSSIINNNLIRFREDIQYKEDGLFLVQYLVKCTNMIAYIPEIVYYYRQLPSSTMGRLTTCYSEHLLSLIDAHGEIYNQLVIAGISKETRKRELRHMLNNYYWILDIMKHSGADTNQNRRELRSRTIKNAGILNYLYQVIILHYYQALKRRIPLLSGQDASS